jgi:hypothetical protein
MDSIITLLHTAVAVLVSDSCAETMITDGDIFDSACLKQTLSKGLGYGVVLGATIGMLHLCSVGRLDVHTCL